MLRVLVYKAEKVAGGSVIPNYHSKIILLLVITLRIIRINWQNVSQLKWFKLVACIKKIIDINDKFKKTNHSNSYFEQSKKNEQLVSLFFARYALRNFSFLR